MDYEKLRRLIVTEEFGVGDEDERDGARARSLFELNREVPMEYVLGALNALNTKTAYKLSEEMSPADARETVRAMVQYRRLYGDFEGPEQLFEIKGITVGQAEKVLTWATEAAQEHHDRKMRRKMHRMAIRGNNQVLYLPQPLMKLYETERGLQRLHFDRRVVSPGLITHIVQDKNQGEQQPVAVPYSCLLMDERGRFVPTPWGVNKWFIKNRMLNMMDKWLWNVDSPGWKLCMNAMQNNAVWMGAYAPSLNSPLLPGGLMKKAKVKLTTIKTVSHIRTAEFSAGTDGSGRIHPDHELFDQLNRPGGACALQWRGINEDGLYVKGILVPDERCVGPNGEPEIWADWLQVKGTKKDWAKKNAEAGHEEYTEIDIGVIQVWDKPSTIKWCFEVLENFTNTEENWVIIEKFMHKAMDDLLEGGIEGLIAKVAKTDPKMSLVIKLVMLLCEATGREFSPLQIDFVKKAVEDKLKRIMWHIATGAGQVGQRYVICIDNGVPPGQVVLGGHKIGSKVAVFRFPVVLSQVLQTLEVCKPLPHHVVNGRICRYVIYMNAVDATSHLMGDDDGDTVAVSSDPDVIKLFENKVDDNVYHVEPEGEPHDMKVNSWAGIRYLSKDPRGPVGILTNYRSSLLAAGDIMGANAIAILIQEAIDEAKNVVVYSNWRMAADLKNWTKRPDGSYEFNHKLVPGIDYDPEAGMPLKLISKWVRERLQQLGGLKEGQNAISWKMPGKRINFEGWAPTLILSAAQGERLGWSGGNLVHANFDAAFDQWQEVKNMMSTEYKAVDMQDLIHELLKSRGINVMVPQLDWEDYKRGLRKTSGLGKFGSEWEKIRQIDDDDERHAVIDRVTAELHHKISKLSLQDLATIWYMEIKYYTPEDTREAKKKMPGNINNALRAVSWDGSPILELLGLASSAGCKFMTPQRTEALVQACLDKGEVTSPSTGEVLIPEDVENAFERLGQLFMNSKRHAELVKDEAGHGIPGHQCRECTEKLQTALVRKIRSIASADEWAWARELVSKYRKDFNS